MNGGQKVSTRCGVGRIFHISVILMLAFMSHQAAAQSSGLIDATKPERILEFAKGFGLAELEQDSSGDPRITGRLDGKRYTIFFYGCKQNVNCTDIQFWASWPAAQSPGLSAVNDWNQQKRFGKASLDRDGDLIFRMPVNIRHGVSSKNLEDSFVWWQAALRGFIKDVVKQN